MDLDMAMWSGWSNSVQKKCQQGFEPRIFEQVLAHNLNFEGD